VCNKHVQNEKTMNAVVNCACYVQLLRGKYTGQSVLGGTFTKEVEYFVRA